MQNKIWLKQLLNTAVVEGLLERNNKLVYKLLHDPVQQAVVLMMKDAKD